MRMSGLLALIALAGCDRVFGLPAFSRDAPAAFDVPTIDGDGPHSPGDARPDSTIADAPNGVLLIEAEQYAAEVQGPNGHDWREVNDSTASGGIFLQVQTDNQISCLDYMVLATCATVVTYNVSIATAGVYYVQVRMFATSAGDQSIWYGVEGVPNNVPVTQPNFGTWSWVVGNGFNLSAGVHSLSLWQRQTGARADMLALTVTASPL